MENILCAIGMCKALNLPMGETIDALRGEIAIPGRLHTVPNDRGITVVVDYAHTPHALETALKAIGELEPRRIITVFGCGGDRDRGKRPLMGQAVAHSSHIAMITSDNPRTEDPLMILTDIEPGVKNEGLERLELEWARERDGYVVRIDRREAIRLAINRIAQPGDVVLIAGKGHEDYQIRGTVKVHFDDFQEAAQALADPELISGEENE